VAGSVTVVSEITGAISPRSGRRDIALGYARDIQTDPPLQLSGVGLALGDSAAEVATKISLRGADGIYVARADTMGVPPTVQRARAARGDRHSYAR